MKEKVLGRIKELKDEFDRLVKESGQPLFVEVVAPLFEFKEVDAVRWNQYVPVFNDGEPCTFSIGDVSLRLTGVMEMADKERSALEANEDLSGDFCSSYSTLVSAKLRTAVNKVESDLADLADIAEKVFDSNAEVTITRDGTVERDYYDCGY